jgi:hypothetical protein
MGSESARRSQHMVIGLSTAEGESWACFKREKGTGVGSKALQLPAVHESYESIPMR